MTNKVIIGLVVSIVVYVIYRKLQAKKEAEKELEVEKTFISDIEPVAEPTIHEDYFAQAKFDHENRTNSLGLSI
jgi:hypothetical protein